MASNGQTYRTPRAVSGKGTTRQDPRRGRPYSPKPPRSGKYNKPSYSPSVTGGMATIRDEDGAQESLRLPSRRPEHLGLLECAFKLNFTDTKRVIVGLDMRTECTPFIAIAKTGGSCVTLCYQEWCELLQNETLISSYFSKDISPHSISIGKFLLKFKTIFGTKSLVIESANQDKDQHSVYLAKSSWYGMLNVEACIKMRLEERKSWSSNALRLVNLYKDSVFHSITKDMEDGECSDALSWEDVSSDQVNLSDIGSPAPTLNVKALSEEISAIFKTQDGRNYLEEIYIQQYSNV